MRLLDRLAAATERLGQEVAQTTGPVVYLRQLLRGDRVPPAAGVTTQRVDEPSPSAPRAPVLLIHGYLANRGSVHLLERRLHERGYVVMSYRIGGLNVGDIRDAAGLIARKVETLVAQTSVQRVDVIGHSMGGLVGLYYLKRLGGRHRMRKLILLGTPATGTWSALLGLVTAPLGRASLQLLPGNAFLKELHDLPIPAGVQVVSVAGERDVFAPVRTTVLEGVRHVRLPTGHSGLLVDEDVVPCLDALLREPWPAGSERTTNGARAADADRSPSGAAVDGVRSRE
jgi:pimeloyl-ACP methyl ester carboxylesterase